MESQRLLLGAVVFAVIFFALFIGKANITGFVPAESFSQKLDIDVDASQRFVISSEAGSLKLSSLSLSGTIYGDGLVNVYLSDGVTRWLAFSNKKRKGSSLEHITGMAVSSLDVSPGEKLGKIETLPDGYVTYSGAFSNECAETCVLDPGLFSRSMLYLDVVIDPGTSLHISEIRFSTI